MSPAPRPTHSAPCVDVVGVGANSIDFVYTLPAYPRPDGPLSKLRIAATERSPGGYVGPGEGEPRTEKPSQLFSLFKVDGFLSYGANILLGVIQEKPVCCQVEPAAVTRMCTECL